MCVVRNDEDLVREYYEVKGEVEMVFGDGIVFLEKFIEEFKYIEVQILGDYYGSIVYFYEWDCLVQCCFQKVVEVVLSIDLKQEICDKFYEYVVWLVEEVDYSCVGIVEFLVD